MNVLDPFMKTEHISYAPKFIICIMITSHILRSYQDTSFSSKENDPYYGPDNITFPARTGGTRKLSALSVVCDIRKGLGHVDLSHLPPGCTAAATSHNNITVVDQMANKPRSVPFFLYYNGFTYLEWGEFLNFPNGFVNLMINEHLDGIIFNNMYSMNFTNPGFNLKRNKQMYEFFSRMKQMNPNALYGLVIPSHAELLPTAFNYNLLDSVIDLYVIKTIHYRDCKFKGIMSRATTAGDMHKSLVYLKKYLNKSVPMTKVLLTVQLYGEGVTEDGKYDILTYSELCGGKELSRSRKYCKDSLKTHFKKASLRNEFGMLGVYVQYVDYDDVQGLCNCDNGYGGYTFPGLAAIISGSQQTNKIDLDCSDFGNLYHN